MRRSGPLTDLLARTDAGIATPGEQLGQVPTALLPTSTARSVCGYCATGCSLTVHLRDGRPVNITPTVRYPVNLGSACPKGWEALAPLGSKDRLKHPMVRDGGELRRVGWDEAAAMFCARMKAVQQLHGPASAAFLSTGQIATEEMALLGAFAKFEMGMVHGDGNTRQCMATSAAAYKQSFGFDAPPYTYGDLEQSDVIVLIGSNLCIAHPILWERVMLNQHNPTVVVVDPRRTETAAASSMHISPTPGTDLALLLGVGSELLRLGAVDSQFISEHTDGFAAWEQLLGEWDTARASDACGVPVAEIAELARVIAQGQRVSLWWTMGVNQGHQAVRTAQAIINIALMTGNIGRPGTGPNSITGQCNAMGSRMFSNTTNLYCGRSFQNSDDRRDVAAILGLDPARIPTSDSLAYDQILEGIDSGLIRALWIVATNTAHSWLDQEATRKRLSTLDFLVVQDLYGDTLTAQHADLLLPAAGWGEKDGSFINAERRVGRIRRMTTPPGEARTDFEIVRTLAEAWGAGAWLDAWSDPAAAFVQLQRLSQGRPCDITGISDLDALDGEGAQWPVTEDAGLQETERRLFEDGRFFHADGRARFVVQEPEAAPELPDDDYPLVLLTGRQSSAQWHTGTRTDRSAVLRALSPNAASVQINPVDAAARSIIAGMDIEVTSRRGSVTVQAVITPIVPAGQVFIGMHHPLVNRLTRITVDPISRQPAAKQSCVQLTTATWDRHQGETLR